MLDEYKKSWINTFNYKGRMARESWNKAVGMHILICIAPSMLVSFLELEPLMVVWGIFGILSFFPILSCLVRRMHDIGKAGWWLLLDLVLAPVLVGWIMFVLQMRKKSTAENKWGLPGKEGNGLPSDSFVDEKLTEADIAGENKKLFGTVLKIIGLVIAFMTFISVFQVLLYTVLS